jgi:hypothetical protein
MCLKWAGCGQAVRAAPKLRLRFSTIRRTTGAAPLTGTAFARERGTREKRKAGGDTPAPRVIARDGPAPLGTVRGRRAPHCHEVAPPTTPHKTHEVSPWTV